ncbi:hypothetical protein CPB84DRAFT_1961730 [Gymnopilus junonius]|uniref:Uncharacterized protein n=1 Tax=Gymnopilus junonius TaxID=109634 RepID=A0A9P5NPA2_GYMJU|nr:hypothetical protein CPB84DRAFT_1961730 [Gymnopilus junonius]
MAEDNSTKGKNSLLDNEGNISEKLESCLKHIFAKYCSPPLQLSSDDSDYTLLSPPPDAYLTEEGLQKWALDTNGTPFSEETKEEVIESFDVTDNGELTFMGFFQLYQLQTENDEEETWKDLQKHGFDRNLNLVKKTA